MDQKTLMRQAIRYQKLITANSLSFFSVIQHSGAEMLKQSLDQYNWMPASSKKSCLLWSERCMEATDQLRSMLEKGFEQAERQLSASSSETPKAKAPSQPSGSAPQSVKTPAQKPSPVKSVAAKSVKTEGGGVPKDPVSPSPKRPSAAQKKTAAAVKSAPKAAAKTKSAKTGAKSTTTKTKSTTPKAKSTATRKTGTAATSRKTSAAKSKAPAAAASSAATPKEAEKPKKAVKKSTAKTTTARPAKQSN